MPVSQAPLLQPGLAVIGQETLAEQRQQQLKCGMGQLRVILVVVLQEVLVVFGVNKEVAPPVEEEPVVGGGADLCDKRL